ncbi:alpha/beta fold hydrolase [Streptomyces sp. NPDC048254]|uniref:alpha/beta fold hydrolase n=1 Tax=Streptomyces sp. NPDC048254 TaxID=3365525 RepID=UPI00371B297E
MILGKALRRWDRDRGGAMEGTHRVVSGGGRRIHLVEQGTGPLVLLVHGFPEGWYSWRHQLPVLAAAGYRAVAIDVRGYGRSGKPVAPDAYRMGELVEDNVAVVRALGEESAVVVGHDWGSTIAANSALLRPEVFRAVGLLSVPYAPRGGPRPSDVFAQMGSGGGGGGGGGEFYVSYFQEAGRAEGEIEPDVRGWLAGFYAAFSGDTMPGPDAPDPHFVGAGGHPEGPVSRRPSARLARRAGSRRLRRGVRTHRAHRRAQPVPEHGPRLGGPRRLRRCPDHPALPVRRRQPRRLHELAGRGHRGVPGHPARPGLRAPS